MQSVNKIINTVSVMGFNLALYLKRENAFPTSSIHSFLLLSGPGKDLWLYFEIPALLLIVTQTVPPSKIGSLDIPKTICH